MSFALTSSCSTVFCALFFLIKSRVVWSRRLRRRRQFCFQCVCVRVRVRMSERECLYGGTNRYPSFPCRLRSGREEPGPTPYLKLPLGPLVAYTKSLDRNNGKRASERTCPDTSRRRQQANNFVCPSSLREPPFSRLHPTGGKKLSTEQVSRSARISAEVSLGSVRTRATSPGVEKCYVCLR